MKPYPINASIYLDNTLQCDEDLKRLALLFDEVHYVLPHLETIKQEVLSNPNRVRIGADGSLDFVDFNYWEDTEEVYTLQVDQNEGPLYETISTLKEHGIAIEAKRAENKEYLKQTKNIIAFRDLEDKKFLKITDTPLKEARRFGYSTLGLVGDNGNFNLYHLFVSNALADSANITELLYLSNQNSLFPVFLDNRHKDVMQYRYTQYKKGLKTIQKISDEQMSPVDYKMSFGEITFSLARALIPSQAITNKTLKDVLKYREAMAKSREQFLTNELRELTSIITDNPWGKSTKDEIQKYIISKFNHSLIQYELESERVWEKMFGTLIVHLSSVAKAAVIGGGASGLIGNIVPNTNMWDMLLLGLLTGALSEVPNLTKDIVDSIIERNKLRKSSIAYLAEFRTP